MNPRTINIVCLLLASAALLAGCGGGGDSKTVTTVEKVQQTPTNTTTATRPRSKVHVPDVTGERLDVAKDDLRQDGLRARTIGGGLLGVVVESNWTVCKQQPKSGKLRQGSKVRLTVDRQC
jgi:beta-lactam-binding protein with PASTA domain